jgi:FHA domain
MTIQCTNPTCKTSIPVPEGTSYVVCPVCNTWHFPSDYDNLASGSPVVGDGDYGLPSTPPLVPDPPMVSPPPPTPATNDPYPLYEAETPSLPSYAPTFHKPVEPEKKEIISLGLLIFPDGRRLPLKLGQNIVGRQCGELSINDPTVSRRHCVIEVVPSSLGSGFDYILYDIGAIEGTASTNGVFIRERSLRLQNYEKIPITNGSWIQLGSVTLSLQLTMP